MEVDGKEFMRNVALEQEQERLRKEQQKLRELKREAVYKKEQSRQEEDESAYVDLSLNDFSNLSSSSQPHSTPYNETIQDIKLEPEDPNKTKKKYILLGLALILVFVITILVIRVISNSDTQESLQNEIPEQKELITDKILDKIDSNEEFQKAVEKKDAQKEMQQLEAQREKQQPKLDLPKEIVQQETPLLIEKPKKEESVRDPLGLDSIPDTTETKTTVKEDVQAKNSVIETKNNITKEQVKVEKKIPQLPQIKPAQPKVNSVQVEGYYVQVGAFTKQPSKTLLNQIRTKGYTYTIHPVNVKGTMYNKVIIGPYPSRTVANKKLPEIKQSLNKSGAYIVKF